MNDAVTGQSAGNARCQGQPRRAHCLFQWTKDEKKLDGYGKPMLSEDGKAVTQRVALDNPVFRVAYVFNAAQGVF